MSLCLCRPFKVTFANSARGMSITTEEAQFSEVTGASWAAAALLEKCKNNVEAAIAYYFDHATELKPDPPAAASETPSAGGLLVPPVIPPQGGTGPRYTSYGSGIRSAAHPIRVVMHLPWGLPTPVSMYFPTNVTVHQLKETLNVELGQKSVPTMLQRYVVKGQNLDATEQVGKLVKTLGSSDTLEIQVLFPRRDEDGPVVFREYGTTGHEVLTLAKGEWSVSTSVTLTRATIAECLGFEKEDAAHLRLVFNGLTMLDATTFGQNGVFAGSVITVLTDRTAPPATAANTGGGRRRGR